MDGRSTGDVIVCMISLVVRTLSEIKVTNEHNLVENRLIHSNTLSYMKSIILFDNSSFLGKYFFGAG